MTIKITAREARNNFADVLNTAVYGKKNVVITRFDKPQAVLIDYEEYERLLNPKLRFSQEEWEEKFKVFDRIDEKAKKISPAEWNKKIDTAIKEVRRKKRDQSSS